MTGGIQTGRQMITQLLQTLRSGRFFQPQPQVRGLSIGRHQPPLHQRMFFHQRLQALHTGGVQFAFFDNAAEAHFVLLGDDHVHAGQAVDAAQQRLTVTALHLP